MSTVTAERESDLKSMKICRFCLSRQDSKQAFTSIYSRDWRIKSTGSLPLQIMAISDIEVYEKDGMPGLICTDCRILFEHCYRFKQMCKKADVLLRQYPLTGCLSDPLEKPRAPIIGSTPERRNFVAVQSVKTVSRRSGQPQISGKSVNSGQNNSPKKILNAAPAAVPEPPVPVRVKLERKGQDAASIFLSKVENDEELSMDDVQLLISDSCDPNEYILTNVEESTTTATDETILPGKPKLLNKSSMRILNKEANSVTEPRLRQPQLTCDEDGNAVIVTQILDPNDPYEPEADPIKNATPIETNVFPCPHCERTFPLRQLRDIHMVNHNRERSFKCPDCEKCFYSKYDLQKHSFVHSGEKPFKCHVCEKAFTRATLLHRHEKTHTDIPKFICLYCERPFISRTEMEKHTERHQKNRPFKCKICDKSFAFKQGLDRHEVTHSSEPPYPCQYCDKSFFTAGKLARHLTAHAGKRAFPCKYCPKSYLLSHHLTRHMRSHKQASSPFTCSVCNEVFKSYANLVEHSNVHATETLVCPLCKETIDGHANVADHIRTHTNGETFACEFCDLIYTNGLQLQEHIRQEHSVDMVPYQQADMQENNSASELPDCIIGGYIIDDEANLIKEESNEIEFISTVVKEKLSNSKALNKINIASSDESLAKRRKISERKVEIETEDRVVSDPKTSHSFKNVVVSSASLQKNIKQEQKTSKEDKSNTVTNVLKSLPKSVSVRRSMPKRATTFVSTTPELNKSTENSTNTKDKQAKNGTTPLNYPKRKTHK